MEGFRVNRNSFCFFNPCNFSEEEVMNNTSYVTADGLQKLKAELDHLKNVERPAISRMIAEARDKGDLSENAEYAAAKEAQGMLEMKIKKLEDLIANTRIIDETKINTSYVQILNRVKIKNTLNNQIMEYTLVSESEANLKAGKIAVSTPIAKALLGKKVGEVVEVKVPSGALKLEILDISI
jgi:transcription elongation factor GreA